MTSNGPILGQLAAMVIGSHTPVINHVKIGIQMLLCTKLHLLLHEYGGHVRLTASLPLVQLIIL